MIEDEGNRAGPWPALVVAVVGPTAAGKSDLALDLAQSLGGEVVSADAFAVYRGMDIGTAKTPPSRRRGLVHHLVDVADIDHNFDVQEYQRLGRVVLRDIARRGVPAIVVGGSGLYVRALLDDLRFPGTDAVVRSKWEARASELGAGGLHRVLAQLDPRSAEIIHPGNVRRMVRALEVMELTGRPFQPTLPKSGPPLVDHISLGIEVDREALDLRVAERVEAMMAAGLLDEVRRLAERGLRRDSGPGRALGYSQLLAHLEGAVDLATAVADTVGATRKLARRQQRWFRTDLRTKWLGPGELLAGANSVLGQRGGQQVGSPDVPSTGSRFAVRVSSPPRSL